MTALDVFIFPHQPDNYGMLLHDKASGHTAMIDAGDAEAASKALNDKGWTLTHCFVTHHHWDHTDGLLAIKKQTGCATYGPDGINGIDNVLSAGDRVDFAGHDIQVIHTPGHTLDMLNYYLPQQSLLFTGDTLFTLGCGRLFEGDAPTMWKSLCKLTALPADTIVYGTHEYAQDNAKFALTIDPNNTALQQRSIDIDELRAKNIPTVPSTLAMELATNPYLRAHDQNIRKGLDMIDASDEAVFTEIRKRKDNF